MNSASPHQGSEAFRHEALLYAGDDEFVAATSRFIRDLVAHRWVSTRQAREHAHAKRILGRL